MSDLDVVIKTEVFRKDHPVIIAKNRHLATIDSARIAYAALGYVGGTVMARNSVSGFYQAYADNGASGIDTAAGILFEGITAEEFNGKTSSMAQLITGGQVFEAKLIGLDAAAKTDLQARSFIDATGTTILMF